MVKVVVGKKPPAENAPPAAPATNAPAPPPAPAAPPAVPATAAPEPVITDSKAREELEHEQFMQSPVTRAVLSGWACSNCGTPVDRKWTHCPVCGSEEVKRRSDTSYVGFDETVEKFHRPKDPGPAKS